jgi:hypothetical protein
MENVGGFLRLRQPFGAPATAWTAAHLHAAIKRGEKERFDLDFKSVLYSGGKECADNVAAMANWQGGVLVLGIEDKEGRATKATPVEFSDTQTLRMRQFVADLVFPTPHWDVREVFDPDPRSGRGFYVLVIPQSPLRPHAMKEKAALRYLAVTVERRVGSEVGVDSYLGHGWVPGLGQESGGEGAVCVVPNRSRVDAPDIAPRTNRRDGQGEGTGASPTMTIGRLSPERAIIFA